MDTPMKVSINLLADSKRMADVEKEHILAVYEETRCNKVQTAEVLGVSLKTLYTKLHSYGIAMKPTRKRAEVCS